MAYCFIILAFDFSSLWLFCNLFITPAFLGRLPGTTVYRNIQQYPEAYTYHGIVIVRIDAPIYFANISHIKERWKDVLPYIAIFQAPDVFLLHCMIFLISVIVYNSLIKK